jgi:hypothetical protein
MEVEYVLTAEDYVAFNRYHQKANVRVLRLGPWVWLVLLALLMGLFLLPAFSSDPKRQPPPAADHGQWIQSAFLFFIIPALVLVILLVWGSRYLLAIQVKRVVTHPDNRRQLLGWRRTAIGPEGVTVRGEEISTQLAWTGVHKIALTQQHAIFYTSALQAFIVPRRPFASDDEFKKFVETAQDYWEKAEDAPREKKPTGRKAVPEPDTGITPEEGAGR